MSDHPDISSGADTSHNGLARGCKLPAVIGADNRINTGLSNPGNLAITCNDNDAFVGTTSQDLVRGHVHL